MTFEEKQSSICEVAVRIKRAVIEIQDVCRVAIDHANDPATLKIHRPFLLLRTDDAGDGGDTHSGEEPAETDLQPAEESQETCRSNGNDQAIYAVSGMMRSGQRVWVRLPTISLAECDEGEGSFK